jgi:hypothetical protein
MGLGRTHKVLSGVEHYLLCTHISGADSSRTIQISFKTYGPGMGSSTSFCSAFQPGYPDYRKLHRLGSGRAEQSKNTKKLCMLWTTVRILEANGVTYPIFHKSWPIEQENGEKQTPTPLRGQPVM